MSSRICEICLLEEAQDDDSEWLMPCTCPAWLHQNCLLLWVQAFETIHSHLPPSCPICLFPFVVLPKKGFIEGLLERIDTKVYESVCEFLAYVGQLLSMEISFAAFGLATLWQIFGLQEAMNIVFSMNFWKAWIVCRYFIPLSLLIICVIPWDDFLLGLMRRASRLPIIGRVLPKREHVVVDHPSRPLWDTLGAAILLPTYAKCLGKLLFQRAHSKLSAVLLGGLLFLVVKSGLRMYYNQKLYRRQAALTVADYNPEPTLPGVDGQ